MGRRALARTKKNITRFSVPPEHVVLVGVLKCKQDLRILLDERWYRIPLAHAPIRPFGYLAFYEPACFGETGKRIRWYARVVLRETMPRKRLLPDEDNDPHAEDTYIKVTVGKPQELLYAIRNTAPRRVSFGYTSVGRLLKAKNLLDLFDVPPTEDIIRLALYRAGISVKPQFWVVEKQKRYRLDFAIACGKGNIAIECDNRKAHGGKSMHARDVAKDAFLAEHGWRVLRLEEHDIIFNLTSCMEKITRAMESLAGPAE